VEFNLDASQFNTRFKFVMNTVRFQPGCTVSF